MLWWLLVTWILTLARSQGIRRNQEDWPSTNVYIMIVPGYNSELFDSGRKWDSLAEVKCYIFYPLVTG